MKNGLAKKAAALTVGISCLASMQSQPMAQAVERIPTDRPNIIYINTDDLGYGDVGCYGSTLNKTPNIDRLAAEGVRFTDFYACPLCTPSRMSLMTGCYPLRAGLPSVIGAKASIGISKNEITVADQLKGQGYATAIVGKWHLGHQEEFLPTAHGFDSYFGLPYSNDFLSPSLPLMRNTSVVEWDPDQASITKRYTEECVDFMKRNRNKPFFLYFAEMYVHKPLRVTDDALAQSQNGRYGATVEQVDESVGAILEAVKDLGLEENTIVIFTSDNGGFLALSPAEGDTGVVSNAPFSGGKGQAMEGGVRVPFIVRWPGQVPRGKVMGEVASVMDMFPTFTHLAGGEIPTDRVIDGKDIWPLMACERDAKSPHDAIFIYVDKDLRAVRRGNWKLNVRNKALFDLSVDPGEKTNLYKRYPAIVEELTACIQAAIEDIGDKNTIGKNARPAGDAGRQTSVYDNVNGQTAPETPRGDIPVMDMIDALPAPDEIDPHNPAHVQAVTEARIAFDSLAEDDQESVMAVNYEDLLAAEAALKPDTGALAAQVERGKEAVEEQDKTPGGKYAAGSFNAFLPIYEEAADALEHPTDEDAVERLTAGLKAAIDALLPILPGDMNGDGSLTITDVMAACKVLARKAAGKAPSDMEIHRGDLTGEGEVTITDVMETCKKLAQKD